MTNTLTLLEIINEACRDSRKAEIANVSEETPLAKESRAHYKRTFQRLVASYPWPYLSKRVELVRDQRQPTDASAYQFRYKPPEDVAFIWDIYHTADGYKKYGYLWDFGAYRAYAFPYDDHMSLLGDHSEIVDGGIESNFSVLYCRYTPKIENPLTYDTTKLTTQFVEVLMKEMSILYEGSNTNVELKALNLKQHKGDIQQMKTLSAIQNRKSSRLEPPHVISLIDRYRRF